MVHTFLITGASSGLGLALATAALQRGQRVIATARNVSKSAHDHPQVEKLGGKWLQLDVDKPETESIVSNSVTEHNVDVLINNAGYALIGAVENISDEEAHAQLNTNVYGVLRAIRGALPSFRERKRGTIVNISSSSGIDGLAGCGLYSATKFAIEGLSESLAFELAPFDISVFVAQPGVLRTNFQSALVQPAKGITPAYEGTPTEAVVKRLQSVVGKQPGDPAKAAERILDAVLEGRSQGAEIKGEHPLGRIILGKDCLKRAEDKIVARKVEIERTKVVAKSIEMDD